MSGQCDGSCHGSIDDGTCARCGSLDPQRMCDDCCFYAMQDV